MNTRSALAPAAIRSKLSGVASATKTPAFQRMTIWPPFGSSLAFMVRRMRAFWSASSSAGGKGPCQPSPAGRSITDPMPPRRPAASPRAIFWCPRRRREGSRCGPESGPAPAIPGQEPAGPRGQLRRTTSRRGRGNVNLAACWKLHHIAFNFARIGLIGQRRGGGSRHSRAGPTVNVMQPARVVSVRRKVRPIMGGNSLKHPVSHPRPPSHRPGRPHDGARTCKVGIARAFGN
jgi:hypothetical protein